jgi:sugar phosphate isomerase/epimerase
MSRFKIGVMSDCFRLGPEEGVTKAAELGAEGVQIWTTGGKMSPEEMTKDARKNFRAFCARTGVAISALCGDIGGYADPKTNPQRIQRSQKILDLAVDLGTEVVTTHIGVVPADPKDPTYKVMLAACREVALHGEEIGVTWAVETGPETAAVLRPFLDDVDSPGIGVNLDPANLVMCAGDDPAAAVEILAEYIVHTHAKDGIKLTHGFKEVPLGTGGVNWDAYLDALKEVGFDGFLTIEREVGDNPGADIAKAIEFLRTKV